MNMQHCFFRLRSFSRYNLLLYAHFCLIISALFKLPVPFSTILMLFGAYLLIGVGGYLLNDWYDQTIDKKAGKLNITASLSANHFYLLLLLFWGFGLFFIFQISFVASYILILQFLLLIAYSQPKIRLKEKGVVGLLVDALYGHVVPVLMLLVVLSDFGHIPLFFQLSFIVLNLFIGIRDILIHQLEDKQNDLKAGVKTFATEQGEKAQKLIKQVVLVTNYLLLFLVYYVLYIQFNVYFLIFTILLTAIFIQQYKKHKQLERVSVFLSTWLLIGYFVKNEQFVFLLLVFHPYFIELSKRYLKTIYFDFFKLYVNVGLYYLFLVFGRDLKKKPLYEKQK